MNPAQANDIAIPQCRPRSSAMYLIPAGGIHSGAAEIQHASCSRCPQIFNTTANTWTVLPGAVLRPMLTNDKLGTYRSDNHAWLFAWSNGTVFQVRRQVWARFLFIRLCHACIHREDPTSACSGSRWFLQGMASGYRQALRQKELRHKSGRAASV